MSRRRGARHRRTGSRQRVDQHIQKADLKQSAWLERGAQIKATAPNSCLKRWGKESDTLVECTAVIISCWVELEVVLGKWRRLLRFTLLITLWLDHTRWLCLNNQGPCSTWWTATHKYTHTQILSGPLTQVSSTLCSPPTVKSRWLWSQNRVFEQKYRWTSASVCVSMCAFVWPENNKCVSFSPRVNAPLITEQRGGAGVGLKPVDCLKAAQLAAVITSWSQSQWSINQNLKWKSEPSRSNGLRNLWCFYGDEDWTATCL